MPVAENRDARDRTAPLVPAPTWRTSTAKSPISSSPSWKPVACRGSSAGHVGGQGSTLPAVQRRDPAAGQRFEDTSGYG